MSTSFRRWDAKRKEASEWRYFELDPELFIHDGNCSIYISQEKLNDNRPSFRIPLEILVSANCRALVQAATIVLTEPDLQESRSGANPRARSSLVQGLHYSLCLAAPDFYSDAEAVQYHITTRNVLAWAIDRPVVGLNPAAALSALKIRMDAWRPVSEDNFDALSRYADGQGYCDPKDLQTMLSNHSSGRASGRHGYKLVETPSHTAEDRRGRRRDNLKETLRAFRRSLSRPRARSASSIVRSITIDNADARTNFETSDDLAMSGGLSTRPDVPSSRYSMAKSFTSTPSSINTNATSKRRSSFLGIRLGRPQAPDTTETLIDNPAMLLLPDIKTRTISDISSELESASRWIENIYRQYNNDLSIQNSDIPAPLKMAREDSATSTSATSAQLRPSTTPRSTSSYTKTHPTSSRAPSPIKEEEADARMSNIPPVPARNAARLSLTSSSCNESATSLNDGTSVHETVVPPTSMSLGSIKNADPSKKDVRISSSDSGQETHSFQHACIRAPIVDASQSSHDAVVLDRPGRELVLSEIGNSNSRKSSTEEQAKILTSSELISRSSWAPESTNSGDPVSKIDDSSKRQTWYTDPPTQTVSPTEILVTGPKPLKSAMKAAESPRRRPESIEDVSAKAGEETSWETGEMMTRFPSLRRTDMGTATQPAPSHKHMLKASTAPSPRHIGVHANVSEPNLTTPEKEARQAGQKMTSLAGLSRSSTSAARHRCRKGHVLPARQTAPFTVPDLDARRIDTTEELNSSPHPACSGEVPVRTRTGMIFSTTDASRLVKLLPSSSHSVTLARTAEPENTSKRTLAKSVSIAVRPPTDIDRSKIKPSKARDSVGTFSRSQDHTRPAEDQSMYFLPRENVGCVELGVADLSAIDKILSEVKHLKQLAAVDGPQEDRERLVRFDSVRRRQSKSKETASSVVQALNTNLSEKKRRKSQATDKQAQSRVGQKLAPSPLSGSTEPSSRGLITPLSANTRSRSTASKQQKSTSTDPVEPAGKSSPRKLKKEAKSSVVDVQASILSFSDYEKYLSKAAMKVDKERGRSEQRAVRRSMTPLRELAA